MIRRYEKSELFIHSCHRKFGAIIIRGVKRIVL